MSYHKLKIHKHDVTSPYKIQEEFMEYLDALCAKNRVMAVQELSDLYCAIENEAIKNGFTMQELKIMADTTKNVFRCGYRKSATLLEYLQQESQEIYSFGLGFIQVKVNNINYNFYHKDAPKFSNVEKPHNHQQDFVSEILKGKLNETVYSTKSGNNVALCGCGDINADHLMLDYTVADNVTYTEGDVYFRDCETFHSVVAEHGTITKVTKYGLKHNAYIITDKLDIPFELLSESELWKMVGDVINEK